MLVGPNVRRVAVVGGMRIPFARGHGAYARVGNFEEALEWLDRAATLSGGLPPAYRAQRARWVLSTAVRLRPA